VPRLNCPGKPVYLTPRGCPFNTNDYWEPWHTPFSGPTLTLFQLHDCLRMQQRTLHRLLRNDVVSALAEIRPVITSLTRRAFLHCSASPRSDCNRIHNALVLISLS
jgi:hypothetical protein